MYVESRVCKALFIKNIDYHAQLDVIKTSSSNFPTKFLGERILCALTLRLSTGQNTTGRASGGHF